MSHPATHRPDEEKLAHGIAPEERRAQGVYLTPAPLVEAILDAVQPLVSPSLFVTVIDPACGAGAFLHGARRRFPHATLLGLELNPVLVRRCAERLPGAILLEGDALRGGLARLLERAPEHGFELWIGNPPYNGTSPILQDRAAYEALRRSMPEGLALPSRTSLRDDYAFFLLLAARRLAERQGALAFITSASLLDSYLYAPVRRALLETLELREVMELGPSVFEGTRVKTCVTVWTSRSGRPGRARYRARAAPAEGGFDPGQLGPAVPLRPRRPEWLLRPPPAGAEELDRAFRAGGQPITRLVPVSFPGLKTRFDELLVDEDPARLLARVRAFLATPAAELAGFAREHALPERTWRKLEALKREADAAGVEADPARVRPFFRYAGARHRGSIPAGARAYCYLDRRLIPRGDHRMQGEYDPHAGTVKLVFNVRELPLCAALLEEEGCVHAHRHTRFAPLLAPRRVLEGGPAVARGGDPLGPLVPNLSARGRAWAERLGGGPAELFRRIVAFINSPPVQDVWAPAFGASRELWIPEAIGHQGGGLLL